VVRLTPASAAARTRQKLNHAGMPMEPGHFLGLQALLAAGGGLACFTLISPLLATKPAGALGLVAAVVVLGWRAPDFWLSRQITARRRGVEKALPDVLDLLSVSVEAGLGFDGAAQKVSEKFPEPVSGEFREYLKAIRLGSSRVDALRSFADRVDLADVRTFCAALIQADQLGVSIGKVLRAQSEAMRVLRKQRVEERAMQLPIKLLFPLILFIFPTIFIVVLGPVVIQFLTVFTKG
jgi:tight adherence protein C